MSALWESPFFGVTLTILAYWAGCKIQKRTGLVICNGLVLAVMMIIAVLAVFDIPYAAYNAGGSLINLFLGPATVCLAVTIYAQIDLLKKHGDALTPTRRIAFHVFFASEPLALRFMEEARQNGFAVGDSEFAPEQELSYGISLLRIAPLEKATIDQLTTCIIRLAAQYGGSLTYWNCPIMGKRR